MARVRKRKLDKGAEARRLARKIAPVPGSTRIVPDKRKKPEKHKKRIIPEEE
jgi:hypothetical protein